MEGVPTKILGRATLNIILKKTCRVVPRPHRRQKSEALRLCFSGSSFTIQVVTWAKM